MIIIMIIIIIIIIPALANGLRKRQEKEAPRLVSYLKIRTLYLEHFLFTHDLFFLSDGVFAYTLVIVAYLTFSSVLYFFVFFSYPSDVARSSSAVRKSILACFSNSELVFFHLFS